jgi:hypothetical protein
MSGWWAFGILLALIVVGIFAAYVYLFYHPIIR